MEKRNEFETDTKRIRNAIYRLYYYKHNLKRASKLVSMLNKKINKEHDFNSLQKDRCKSLVKYNKSNNRRDDKNDKY